MQLKDIPREWRISTLSSGMKGAFQARTTRPALGYRWLTRPAAGGALFVQLVQPVDGIPQESPVIGPERQLFWMELGWISK